MNEDFESYRIEDDEEENGAGHGEVKRFTMWTIVPRIMTMPSSGWEMARHNAPSPELATVRFLLPLSLLSGFSVFLTFLYPRQKGFISEENGFTVLLVNAVIQFCSFFLGYFLALVLAKLFLPKDVRDIPSTPFGKILTMTGTATLAFFHILYEAFPMLDFILVFLPLWTIFIVFKGMDYTGVRSEKHILSVGVMCLVVVTGPTLVEWVLALFA